MLKTIQKASLLLCYNLTRCLYNSLSKAIFERSLPSCGDSGREGSKQMSTKMEQLPYLTLRKANEIADSLRKRYGFSGTPFIDITELASKLGFAVYESIFEDDNIAGTVEHEQGSIIINVNSNDLEPRKRFTIAHELAHILLQHNEHSENGEEFIEYRMPLEYYETETETRKEIQANLLAASLLMPEDLIQDIWNKTGDVNTVAKYFGVSKRAAMIRLDSMGLLD